MQPTSRHVPKAPTCSRTAQPGGSVLLDYAPDVPSLTERLDGDASTVNLLQSAPHMSLRAKALLETLYESGHCALCGRLCLGLLLGSRRHRCNKEHEA